MFALLHALVAMTSTGHIQPPDNAGATVDDEEETTSVRVLFHPSISRISIYTGRAISAQWAMFHVMESSVSQHIEK